MKSATTHTPISLPSFGMDKAKTGGKVVGWVKLAGLIAVVLLIAVSSGGWEPFLLLTVGGGLMLWDCVKHPAHLLRYLGAMVVFTALQANAITGPAISDLGAGGISARTVGAARSWWESHGTITVNTTPPTTAPPAPTTTAAP